MKDWKTKRFLVNCIEGPHKKKSEYFHNGKWFILQEGLTEVLRTVKEPKVENNKEKTKTCLLCEEKEYEQISYRVKKWDEYTPYYDRENTLIMPSADFCMHYFELKFPFNKKKKEYILKNIEKNVPKYLIEKSDYYAFQKECLDFLKEGNIKTNGHFLTCEKHSNEQDLEKSIGLIIETALGSKHGFCFHPYLGNNVISTPWPLDDFLKMHYTKEEIVAKILSTEKLEKNIAKYAYLAGFD